MQFCHRKDKALETNNKSSKNIQSHAVPEHSYIPLWQGALPDLTELIIPIKANDAD